MTQLTAAVEGKITSDMEQVAVQEGVTAEYIRKGVAAGSIVIPGNINRSVTATIGIGTGLTTKVSASVGLYGKEATIKNELEKVRAAVKAGTNSIIDLSVSGDIDTMRKETLETTPTPVGTLPLYQAIAEAARKYGSSLKMRVEDLFELIERHAEDGVDFLALHCGMTMDTVQLAKQEGRIDPLVSFGGAHLMGWMLNNNCENPLYEHYDRILEIARKYHITISIADGMRPGCLADSLDSAQIQELVVIGQLVRRARAAGVQVMVKGPGHAPMNQIKATVALQKSLCHGVPYFVFGPVVTDIAAGYDHISGAIGAAISAWAGADFICYVTASEHLGLPDVEQVREGVTAARIAAHAADLAKDLPGAALWDLELSKARKAMDWKQQIQLAISPERAEYYRKTRSNESSSACAMCGKYCAMEVVAEYLGITKISC